MSTRGGAPIRWNKEGEAQKIGFSKRRKSRRLLKTPTAEKIGGKEWGQPELSHSDPQ